LAQVYEPSRIQRGCERVQVTVSDGAKKGREEKFAESSPWRIQEEGSQKESLV